MNGRELFFISRIFLSERNLEYLAQVSESEIESAALNLKLSCPESLIVQKDRIMSM